MDRDPRIILRLVMTVFPRNTNLVDFLTSFPHENIQDLINNLPDDSVPKTEYFREAIDQIRAYNLDTPLFFDMLKERFDLRGELIDQARAGYFTSTPTTGGRLAEPLPTRKALLRSLLPFEDGDELVGRSQEVQSVMTIIRSNGFRFGVVWGRSGCGKTSMLRAGLLPKMRDVGIYPIYFERPIYELMTDQEATLKSWMQAGGTEARSQPIVVVIDQLEEFFLRTKERTDHQRLADFINAALAVKARPIAFLLGIREDFFGKLHHLAIQEVPDPTKPATCFELEELAPEVAEEILHTSVAIDGTLFDADLIRKIVKDLTAEGFVRPVELQIVGSALKQRRIKNKNGYDTVGGARGLLQTYIKDEIASCPDKQMAALILRRLCAEGRPVKSPEDVSEDALADAVARAGLSPPSNRSLLNKTLERLIQAKLVVQHSENLYNLVHDFIASMIPVATAGIEPAKEQANRLIVKYLAEYRDDPKFRIPRRHLRLIRSNADPSLLADATVNRLYFQSIVSAVSAMMVPVAWFAGAFAVAYITLFLTEYLSTDPARFVKGLPSIVVRAGHPSLKFLPGFDAVKVDTGYFMSDVAEDNPEAQEAIPRERLVVFTWPGKNGHSQWADELFPQLSPLDQVAAWRLIGRPEQAVYAAREWLAAGRTNIGYSLGLLGATLDSGARDRILSELREIFAGAGKPEEQAATAAAIGHFMLAGGDRASLKAIFHTIFSGYMELAGTEESDERSGRWELTNFQRGANALILAAPELVEEQNSKALLDFVADPKSDPFRVPIALEFLQLIGLANPDRTHAIIGRLVELIATDSQNANSQRPSWSDIDKIRVLRQLAEAYPSEVSADVLAPLAKLIIGNPKQTVVMAYGLAASRNPTVVTPDTVASLRSCATPNDVAQPKSEAANDCALALMRLQGAGAEGGSAITEASGSHDDTLTQSARYLALVAHPQLLSGEKRSALLKGFIGGECAGSPDNVLDEPNGYSRFYTALRANADVFTPDHVQELKNTFEACRWSGSKHYFVELLLAVAKYQPDATLQLEHDLSKLDGGGFVDSSEANRELHEQVVAALARADYERRKADGSLSLETIQSMLKRRDRADARTSGSYAAYLFWLDEKDKRAALENLLRGLAAQRDADVRMAANRALEMIWIARLTTANPTDVPAGLARARLITFERDFDPPVATAARLAVERLVDAQHKQ